MQDVCFRHLADIPIVQQTPAFGGKRTWLSHRNMSARDPRGQRASLGQKYSLFLVGLTWRRTCVAGLHGCLSPSGSIGCVKVYSTQGQAACKASTDKEIKFSFILSGRPSITLTACCEVAPAGKHIP
jgi:hypothetical protein